MTYIINYTNTFTNFVYENTHNTKLQFWAFVAVWAFSTPLVGGVLEEFGGIRAYEFTEELMKALSCGLGAAFAIAQTFVFAVGEMYEYITKPEVQPLYDEGWYWNFFAYRLTCVMDHMIYLSVHLIGYKISIKKQTFWAKFNVRAIAFCCAWAIHLIHNNGWGLWIAENVFGMM
jgi:hypothetical protein